MSEKEKKRLKSVVAVSLAAALLVTGTMASQSISQAVTNQLSAAVNPGGRLHDDFDGKNKDIYVENFTDSANGGVPIYARVKLTEYMEVGADAGKNLEDAQSTRSVKSIATGSVSNDKDTWANYFDTTTTGNEDKVNAIKEYWTWQLGGKTTYMPTFNKNKDSIAADINGTYEGLDGYGPLDENDSDEKYSDYVSYSVGSTATKYEIYDADSNTTDEIGEDQKAVKAIIDAADQTALEKAISGKESNIKIGTTSTEGDTTTYTKVTHEAKDTIDGSVISMAKYNKLTDEEKKALNAWVYDTDGWAYWSQAIQPGEATGLLLDDIGEILKNTSDNWYYAIDVTAQFITADDSGYDDNTGFWDTNSGSVPTDDAKALLKSIGVTVEAQTGGNTSEDTSTYTPSASTDAAKAIQTKIYNMDSATVNTTAATVTIDNKEFYVIAKENGKALLLQKDLEENSSWTSSKDTTFGTSSAWEGSTIQTYLNGTYLDGKTELNELVSATDIYTATPSNYNRDDMSASGYTKSENQKVFLLSEADVFGTANGSAVASVAESYEYTTASKTQVASEISNNGVYYWLRSPYKTNENVAIVTTDGDLGSTWCKMDRGVRPALWVNL